MCYLLNYGYHDRIVKILNEELTKSVDFDAVQTLDLIDSGFEASKESPIVDIGGVFGRYLKLCSEYTTEKRAGMFDLYGDRPEGYEDKTSPISVQEQLDKKLCRENSKCKNQMGQVV